MLFQSHVPSFVDADPAVPKQYFKDTNDLLSHPWVRDWNKGQKGFRFCWSENEGRWSVAHLMAEWEKEDGEKIWWVLGYLDEIPDLPKWSGPESQNEIKQEETDILIGTSKPTGNNRYKARDGMYYNGYLGSPDAADDFFGEAIRLVAARIEESIEKESRKKPVIMGKKGCL